MHIYTSTYTQSYICQTCAYTNCQSYLNFTCTHILVKEYFPCIQTFVFVFGDVSFSCFLCYKYKKLFLILTPMVLPVLVYIQFYFIFFLNRGIFTTYINLLEIVPVWNVFVMYRFCYCPKG